MYSKTQPQRQFAVSWSGKQALWLVGGTEPGRKPFGSPEKQLQWICLSETSRDFFRKSEQWVVGRQLFSEAVLLDLKLIASALAFWSSLVAMPDACVSVLENEGAIPKNDAASSAKENEEPPKYDAASPQKNTIAPPKETDEIFM
ncbi:hypothetical protein TNCV_3694611 [Trichonephila clavipes]|nr:hypothetical protein TNCV_3694611 [Trichonephila clavipes]